MNDRITGSPMCMQSKNFALDVIRGYRHLIEDRKEYVLSKQFVRAGTSIGANIHEAVQGQSRADFVSKLSIALKEASETSYWLDLLLDSSYLNPEEGNGLREQLVSLARMLTASIKTAKRNSDDTVE